jgi:hypothetical protein
MAEPVKVTGLPEYTNASSSGAVRINARPSSFISGEIGQAAKYSGS